MGLEPRIYTSESHHMHVCEKYKANVNTGARKKNTLKPTQKQSFNVGLNPTYTLMIEPTSMRSRNTNSDTYMYVSHYSQIDPPIPTKYNNIH